jgi:shikimate dehydrogenase
MRGYNTDAEGFRRAVEAAFDFDFEGKCIFVLGTGGAGRTTALTAAQAGAAHITLTDLDIRRAQQLREEITRAFPNTQTDVIEGAQATPHAARADLIVQATPIGMEKGDPSLLEPEAFHERQCVFDLIYMYPETPLMQAAGEAGAQTANGLGMLLHQGALALSIWTGREPPLDVMRRVLEERVYC